MRQWFAKLRWQLQRWMQGRYGQDSLTLAILVFSIVLLLCASIFSSTLLLGISFAALLFGTFRTYSKNIAKRRAENDAWLKLTAPARQWWSRTRKRWAERKTHRYFKCPKCGQYLRVPKGKGKIMITCKSCGERFERKS